MYNHKLRGLIRNAGMSQGEFAIKVGIHYATISKIINNIIRIPEWQKQAIADYFGKSVDDIFNKKRGVL